MALKLITAPQTYPVTLAEAKKHLNVDYTDDDDMITTFIAAATSHVDGPVGFLGRALIDQTWELTLDEFPDNEIKIPIPPLIAVESVKYDDTAGVEITIDPQDYTVDAVSEPGWVLPESTWPATFDGINAVRIRFRAGYLDQSVSPVVANVPADIRIAILLYVGTLYANRENEVVGVSVTKMPWAS